MAIPNTDVKTSTPPPASAPSSGAQTPLVVPAAPASGGGKPQESVPYSRFQEVNNKVRDMEEELSFLRTKVQTKPQPVNQNSNNDIPSPEEDPLGHMTRRMERMENFLQKQEQRFKAEEGRTLLEKIKVDYPIYADEDVGAEALDVLSARLKNPDVEQGLKPPAKVIREVAEKFSNLKVAVNNAIPATKTNAAVATSSIGGGSPDIGAVQPAAFKPKSFEDAHKAAKGRWDSLAQKVRQSAQV